MNDTHGVNGEGWYGFDLDGTLAKYDKWKGIDNIGDPVDSMVSLMKRMHDEGKRVKILTARVSPRSNPETKPNPYHDEYVDIAEDDKGLNEIVKRCPWLAKREWTAADFVKNWCDDNIGFIPEITHEKDHLMLELYDDRVKQVFTNTGVLVEDELDAQEKAKNEWRDMYRRTVEDESELQKKIIELYSNSRKCFILGALTACAAFALALVIATLA